MEREIIYLLADPEKKVLGVHEAFALLKGDELVWETPGSPVVAGPLAVDPYVTIYTRPITHSRCSCPPRQENKEIVAAVSFTVETGEEYWEEFVEAYPLGQENDPKAQDLKAELIDLFEKIRGSNE